MRTKKKKSVWGRLDQDPGLRFTETGVAVSLISVDGRELVAWRETAIAAAFKLRAGQKVCFRVFKWRNPGAKAWSKVWAVQGWRPLKKLPRPKK